MAQYPKMYRSGVQITTLNRSGVSLNDANRSGYRVFHKHTNACYTIPVYHVHSSACGQSGGGCGGGDAMWYCAECGYEQGIGNRWGSGHYDGCSAYGRSDNNGCYYHDNESDCSDWSYGEYNCGKTESTIERYDLGCGFIV